MKLTHTQLLGRCIVALAALGGVGIHAGPVEDTTRAETLIRGGDIVTAMGLLRQAADRGHAPAQARLGDLLRASEDYAQAVELYRKAADQGDPAGEVGLGRMYADGYGVPRDPAKALALYRKAEGSRYWPALDMLARAYRAGDLGLPRDLARAQELEAQLKVLMTAKEAAR